MSALVAGTRDSAAQSGTLRWAGHVADTFSRETPAGGVESWTCEDGGRIRHRNPVTGAWASQTIPTEVKDTIHRVFFLPNGTTGWAVGAGGWVLHTVNGGTNWTVLARVDTPLFAVGSVPADRDPYEELFDVHFLDSDNGWMVGIHSIWSTANGGQAWTNLGPPYNPLTSKLYDLTQHFVELYALDILVRPDGSRLGLIVGQPGVVFRSTDANLASWELVWDVQTLCPSGTTCGQLGSVLQGCECDICEIDSHTGPWFEIWDVEISGHPTSPLAVFVGGFGFQCGMIFASTNHGATWGKEWHECVCIPGDPCVYGGPCTGNPLYEDDPGDPVDLNRHQYLRMQYGVHIFDSDNAAVAVGYNAQHLVRNPATGKWLDRSEYAAGVPTVLNSVTFPLSGASGLTLASGAKVAVIGGMGGLLRESFDGGHTWDDRAIAEPHRIADVCFVDETNGWRVGQFFRIAKTLDGGVSWDEQFPPSVGGVGDFRSIVCAPVSQNPAVAVGDPFIPAGGATTSLPKIRITSNLIQPAWSDSVTILGASTYASFLDGKALRDVTWLGGTDFWAVGNGGLAMKSSNGGATWRLVLPELQSSIQDFQMEGIAFYDTTTGLIAGRRPVGGVVGGVVYQYRDVGTVPWIALSLPASVTVKGLWDVAIGNGTAWVVGEKIVNGFPVGVVLTSTFSGNSFGALVESGPGGGFPRCLTGEAFDDAPILNDVKVAPATGEVWVGGACGRLWRRSAAGVWTEVKSQTDAHILGMSFVQTGTSTAAGYLAGFRSGPTQQSIVKVQ